MGVVRGGTPCTAEGHEGAQAWTAEADASETVTHGWAVAVHGYRDIGHTKKKTAEMAVFAVIYIRRD